MKGQETQRVSVGVSSRRQGENGMWLDGLDLQFAGASLHRLHAQLEDVAEAPNRELAGELAVGELLSRTLHRLLSARNDTDNGRLSFAHDPTGTRLDSRHHVDSSVLEYRVGQPVPASERKHHGKH